MKTEIKKISMLLLVVALLLLTACDDAESTKDTDTRGTAGQQEIDEKESDSSDQRSINSSKAEETAMSTEVEKSTQTHGDTSVDNTKNHIYGKDGEQTKREESQRNETNILPEDINQKNNNDEWLDNNVDQDGWS